MPLDLACALQLTYGMERTLEDIMKEYETKRQELNAKSQAAIDAYFAEIDRDLEQLETNLIKLGAI